jgi:hypothetical protein
MTTNPSHILIARNSRGTHNPSASLSSPTETHAAASGIFRSSGSPPWHLEGVDTDDVISDLSTDEGQDPIDVDEPFTRCSEFPGTVKIVVEATTFWCVPMLPRKRVLTCPKDSQGNPVLFFSFLPGRAQRRLGRNWSPCLHVFRYHYIATALCSGRQTSTRGNRDDIHPGRLRP